MKKLTKRIITLFIVGVIGFSSISMDILAAEALPADNNSLENIESETVAETVADDLLSPAISDSEVIPVPTPLLENTSEDESAQKEIIENTTLEESTEKASPTEALPQEQQSFTIVDITQLSDDLNTIFLQEKVNLDQLEKMFPVEINVQIAEESERRNLAVKWVCSADYQNSEMEEYYFSPLFGSEYTVANDAQIPSITIKCGSINNTEENSINAVPQSLTSSIDSEYTITYFLNGGINSINNPQTYSVASGAITFEDPTRTGCSFGGWYSDKEFKVKVSGIDAGNTGDIILYAKWILNQYTIKFDANNRNALGVMSNLTCTYGKSVTLPLNQFKLTGYDFGGWNTKPDGTGTKYADVEQIANLTSVHKETVTLYAQWRKLKYSITYVLNGGNNSSFNPDTYASTDTFVFQNPTRQGCTFIGWYSDAEFKNELTELKRGSTGNLILYAKWKRDNYTISYFLSGGINNTKNPTSYNDLSSTIVLQNPTRAGYSFDGWYAENNYKTKISEIKSGNTGNLKLYAKWIPNKYMVSFHSANSTATGNMENLTCTYGEEELLPANSYKVKGYTFKGWNTKSDGSGIFYRDGSNVKNLTPILNKTVTLYAQWEREKYSITYNMNGGINNMKNPNSYTITSTVVFNNATRTGYSFGGWYSDKNFKNRIYKIPKGSTGNYVIYSKWVPAQYRIKLHSANSNATGSMDMLKCSYGEIVTLPKNKFTLKGYYFGGWNTKANGTGTGYRDNVPVKNLTASSNEIVTLYAQWKISNYNIEYNLNGGYNHAKNPKRYTINSPSIILQKPTRDGYAFGGWYLDSNFNKVISKIEKGSIGNRVLYAKWIPNQYTVRFSSTNSNASGVMNSISCSYGKTIALPANQYKLNGYGFVGWNTKPNGTGITYKNGEQIKNLTAASKGTVTLYAQWKKANYTITYNLDGGKNNSSNPTSYTITSDTITLQNPVKAGYTFVGWYSNKEYTNAVSQIKTGSTGNRTIYARWKNNQYTVCFNPNGKTATGKMSDVYCTYGKTATLPPSSYKMKGYAFSCWNTRSDGKGSVYKDNAEVKNVTSKPNATVTLYAQWKRINYAITYKLNGGTNSPKNPKNYTIVSATFALKNPSRVGYDFGGWYTDSQFRNRVFQVPLGSIGNKTFYAKWIKQ